MLTVLNEYPNSHHYWVNLEKSDLFCPNCGKQELWQELNEGDYYLGCSYYCISCTNKHHLDSTCYNSKDSLKIIKQLKSGKADIPTTKRGN